MGNEQMGQEIGNREKEMLGATNMLHSMLEGKNFIFIQIWEVFEEINYALFKRNISNVSEYLMDL